MAPIEIPVPGDVFDLYYPPSLRTKYGLGTFAYDPELSSNGAPAPISWQPDRDLYQTRLNEAQSSGNTGKNQLPEGWPAQMSGPLVWKGTDYPDLSPVIHELTLVESQEVSSALASFKALNLGFSDVSKETFPLPTLGPVLAGLSSEVHSGRGFFVLRGLKPQENSDEDNLTTFLGVSTYVAEQRGRMTTAGDMNAHIVAAPSDDDTGPERQPIFTNQPQPFHSDIGADILAFYTLSAAKQGGDHLLASSWTLYNELQQSHPDLLAELTSNDWVHNTYGHYPPWFNRPLLLCEDGKPILNFSRRVITGNAAHPRDDRAPPITIPQANALDAVQFTAGDNQLRLPNVTGDMIFVNNFGILHARDGFEDDETSKRHLLRLWLRNDEVGWKIPQGLQLEHDNLFEPAEELPPVWQPKPIIRLRLTKCG